jgi:hypothetical protein
MTHACSDIKEPTRKLQLELHTLRIIRIHKNRGKELLLNLATSLNPHKNIKKHQKILDKPLI